MASEKRLYTAHEVAVIIAELFGDDCACNFNSIDEWLPFRCELQEACPHPVGVACWEQYLKHRRQKMANEVRLIDANDALEQLKKAEREMACGGDFSNIITSAKRTGFQFIHCLSFLRGNRIRHPKP